MKKIETDPHLQAVAAWVGLGCYYEPNPDIQWRLCLCLQGRNMPTYSSNCPNFGAVIAPGLLLILSPWIPESPRWLVANDKSERALEILRRLHKTNEDSHDIFAKEEYLQIHEQIRLEKMNRKGFFAMLKEPSTRKRFFCGLFVQCIGQSTGVLVTSNYQILLWNNLGIHGSMPLVLYGLYTSWAAFLNLVSSRIIDRFGRVRLMTIGLVYLPISIFHAASANTGVSVWLRPHAHLLHGNGGVLQRNLQPSRQRLRRRLPLPLRHLLRQLLRCMQLRVLLRNLPHQHARPGRRGVDLRPVFHDPAIHRSRCDRFLHHRVEVLPRLHHRACLRPPLPCPLPGDAWPQLGGDLCRVRRRGRPGLDAHDDGGEDHPGQ
jgi:hypothetical protein